MRTIVVEGVEVPESLIASEVQNHPSASAAEARAAAAHALAIRALLLNRAEELGLEPEPELDEAGREETPEEALVRAVLAAEVEIEPPTEAECLRVYEASPGRFRTPALYEASHILIQPRQDEAAADEAARQAALAAIAELGRRPGAFAELAKALSDCPSREVGGSLGQLQTGDLVPEVEAAIGRLAPGEVGAEPIRSRFGWHVLRLDRRLEGRQMPFEYVADRIRMNLESRAWAAAAVRYVAELGERARGQGVALGLTENGDLKPPGLTLGDMIADAESAARLEPWLVANDPDLAERVAEAAVAEGAPVADYVRQALADFVRSADDESWTRLISAAQGAQDPALAGITAVLKTKLQPPKRSFTIIRKV